MGRCPHCGAGLPPVADAFCPGCGRPLAADVPRRPMPPPLPARRRRPWRPVDRQRLAVGIAVLLLAAGDGVHAALPTRSGGSNLVLSLGLAVCVALWCALDARAAGRPLLWPARLVLVVGWPVAAPVCLAWGRGGRGVLRAAGYSAVFVGAMFAAAAAAVVALAFLR